MRPDRHERVQRILERTRAARAQIEAKTTDDPGPEIFTDLDLTLAQIERQHILRMLERTGGNISEAARRLGIYRSSLQRRLRKLRG